MKLSLIVISLLLVIIFVFNANNTYRSFSNLQKNKVELDSTTEAYEPTRIAIAGYAETEKRMSSLIVEFKKNEDNAAIWNMVFNLLVTLLTGFTTLLTSISTIKNGSVAKRTGITIAIFTFISSLLSFGQSQCNTYKEKAQKNKENVITIRNEFEALKPEEIKKQIEKINRKLDEEFH